jgi:hypothetical protein
MHEHYSFASVVELPRLISRKPLKEMTQKTRKEIEFPDEE